MKIRAKISDLQKKFKDTSFIVHTDCNPADIEELIDKDVDIEIRIHKNQRSLKANAKLWASLSELASKVHMTTWDMYLEELKNYGCKFVQVRIKAEAIDDLKREWRAVDVVGEEIETESKLNPDTGYPKDYEQKYLIVNCYLGSHTYNTKEFSVLLEGVIQEMDSVGIPSYEMRRLLKEVKEGGKL